MRAELQSATELNQKLYQDIEMMTMEQEKTQMLEDCVKRFQMELTAVKDKLVGKDL